MENLVNTGTVSIMGNKNTLVKNKNFNKWINTIYDWVKKLKLLGTNIHINVLQINGNIVIELMSPNKLMVPYTIKNISITQYIRNDITLQSITSIYDIKGSIPQLINLLSHNELHIDNEDYIELERMCLKSIEKVRKIIESKQRIINIDKDTNFIFYAHDIVSLHMKCLGATNLDIIQTMHMEEQLIRVGILNNNYNGIKESLDKLEGILETTIIETSMM